MDFKVAGTTEGITAIQMDIKIKGIDEPILRQALRQAHDARMFILGKMLECLPEPRDHMSKYAPKITRFTINPEKIREVIGPGGKMINKIIAETGVKIDIEDDGRVYISTPDEEASARARSMIEGIAKDPQVGDVFRGKVVRIMQFGAFVEFAPGKDGLVHISKLADKRVEKVEDVVNIGDELEVRVAEIDSQGRINLVRNDITYTNNEMPVRRPPRPSFGDRDRRPPGSIADAFCRAYYAAGAVERALGTHAPDRGARMAMAAARVMQIANLLDADLQPEIERKIARNRRRVYIKDADGITRRVSDAKADESDIPAGVPMRELQHAVYQNKVDKGFNITDINLEICLIYGELNESYDAYLNSPETVGEELADVMIYLMGLSEIVGIDLQAELERGLFEGAV